MRDRARVHGAASAKLGAYACWLCASMLSRPTTIYHDPWRLKSLRPGYGELKRIADDNPFYARGVGLRQGGSFIGARKWVSPSLRRKRPRAARRLVWSPLPLAPAGFAA